MWKIYKLSWKSELLIFIPFFSSVCAAAPTPTLTNDCILPGSVIEQCDSTGQNCLALAYRGDQPDKAGNLAWYTRGNCEWKPASGSDRWSLFYDSLNAFKCTDDRSTCMAVGSTPSTSGHYIYPVVLYTYDFGMSWSQRSSIPMVDQCRIKDDWYDFILYTVDVIDQTGNNWTASGKCSWTGKEVTIISNDRGKSWHVQS